MLGALKTLVGVNVDIAQYQQMLLNVSAATRKRLSTTSMKYSLIKQRNKAKNV